MTSEPPTRGFHPEDPTYRLVAWSVAVVLAAGFAFERYAGSSVPAMAGAAALTVVAGAVASWVLLRWRGRWRVWWPFGSVGGVAVVCLAQVGLYMVSPDLKMRRDLRVLAEAIHEFEVMRDLPFIVTRRTRLPPGFEPSARVDISLVTPQGWWTATASTSTRKCTLWGGAVPEKTRELYPEIRDGRIWCRSIDALR